MKVKEAIEYLQAAFNEDEEIFIGWWCNESFDISEEDWKKHMDEVERKFDWSNTHEMIELAFDYAMMREASE